MVTLIELSRGWGTTGPPINERIRPMVLLVSIVDLVLHVFMATVDIHLVLE